MSTCRGVKAASLAAMLVLAAAGSANTLQAQACNPICRPGNSAPVIWVGTEALAAADSVRVFVQIEEVDAEHTLILDSLQLRRNGSDILDSVSWSSYTVDQLENTLSAVTVIQIDTGWTVFTVRICDTSEPTAACGESSDSVYRASPPPPPPSQTAPEVRLLQRADAASLSACGGCSTVSHTYTTPAYVSLDASRALSLSYSSAAANPVGLVVAEATTRSSQIPTRLAIQLRRRDTGVAVTLTNGATKAYYLGDTGTVALAAQFDASGLASGSYAFDVIVESHWSSGTAVLADTTQTRLLILNEQQSRFGAGWSLSLPRLVEMSDSSVMLFDGVDALLHFSPGSCSAGTCSYSAPAGVFSVLTRHPPITAHDSVVWSLVSRSLDSTTFFADGRLRHVKDRYGNRTLVEYELLAGIPVPVRIKDPVDKMFTLTYASDTAGGFKLGSLRRITSPDGRIIRTKVTRTTGDLVEIRDPRPDSALAFAAGYAQNRMVRSRERMPAFDSVTYDAFGYAASLRSPVVSTTSGSTRVATYFTSLEAKLLLPSGVGTTLSDSTGHALRADSAFASVMAPTGAETRTWRDVSGGPRRSTLLSASSNPQNTDWTYNSLHQPVRIYSPGERLERYIWDGPRLTFASDAMAGRFIEATYDSLDLVATYKVNGQLQYTNYFSGSRFHPDSTRTDSNSVTKYSYDSRGRVTSVRDATNNQTTMVFDTLGVRNLQRITLPDGSVTQFAYDSAGRQHRVTTALGYQYFQYFDALNRDTLSLAPGGVPTRASYQDSTGLRVVVDARSNQYRDSVNAAGWPVSSRDPRGKLETYSYDSAGRLVETTNRRGQTVGFAYDSLGRLLQRTMTGDTARYTYAADRSWVRAQNAESIDTIRFQNGRRVSEVAVRDTFRFIVSPFVYAFGLPSGTAVARWTYFGATWGFNTGSGYDPLLRINYLRDYGGHETAITYNRRGLANGVAYPTSPTFSSRLKREILYDSVGRSLSEQYSVSGINLAHGRTYQRRGDGSIEKSSQVGASYPVYQGFSYDSLSRLLARRTMQDFRNVEYVPWDPWGDCPGCVIPVETFGTDTTEVHAFSYDRIGTRTDKGAVIDSVGNRVTSFDGYSIAYDSAGFVVSKSKSGDSRTYSWNAIGQLTQVVVNGVTTSYGYDAFGRRVRRTAAGVTTRYLYNGGELVAEVDTAGGPVALYTYFGLDAPQSMRREDKLYYYLQDAQGNVRALVDTLGAVVATYDYSPYGELTGSTGSVENPLRFKGREWDAAAGLYFMRARYYDAQMGRFLSPDPIGVAGGVNQYAFAGADPINFADPTGLQCVQNGVPCLDANRITATYTPPSSSAFPSHSFASGIYWLVSHRYGAGDGSVSPFEPLHRMDREGISEAQPAAAQYLARVLEAEQRCYSDLRQTLFSAGGDLLGIGVLDSYRAFKGLLQTSQWEGIGARAAQTFSLTPPALFGAGLLGQGTPNPFGGSLGIAYSTLGFLPVVGTVRDLLESVHSCVLAAP